MTKITIPPQMTQSQQIEAAVARPWAALEYAAALLSPARLDACAVAKPVTALVYAAALLTPETKAKLEKQT
jgi:hypothetical protein